MTAWLDACLPEGRLPSEAMPFRASLAELGCPIVDFGGAVAMHKVDILRRQYNGELISKEELESAVFGRVLQAARASHRIQPRIKSIQRGDAL